MAVIGILSELGSKTTLELRLFVEGRWSRAWALDVAEWRPFPDRQPTLARRWALAQHSLWPKGNRCFGHTTLILHEDDTLGEPRDFELEEVQSWIWVQLTSDADGYWGIAADYFGSLEESRSEFPRKGSFRTIRLDSEGRLVGQVGATQSCAHASFSGGGEVAVVGCVSDTLVDETNLTLRSLIHAISPSGKLSASTLLVETNAVLVDVPCTGCRAGGGSSGAGVLLLGL